jgi:hypothetical protein
MDTTQTQDPNQMLQMMLSFLAPGQAGGGDASKNDNSIAEGETAATSQAARDNIQHYQAVGANQIAANRNQYGQAPAVQPGLLGHLLKGVIGSGVSNYVGNKLSDMNASRDAERIKKALPDASPAAIQLLSGGGDITQALGKTMLANQFKTPDVQPPTDLEQKLMAAGLKPGTVEYQNAIKQSLFGGQDLSERKFVYDQTKDAQTNADNKAKFEYQQKQDVIANANKQTDNTRQFNATQFQQENVLNTNHTKESQNFIAIRNATKNVFSALETATTSSPATLAAGTAFMKLLDPGSVVRESELGMALQAQGVFDRITNMLNIVQSGKVLTTAQAAEFKDLTKKIYNAAEVSQKQLDAQYTGRAVHYGLDPKNVVTDYYPGSPDVTPAAKAEYEDYKKYQEKK